MNPTQVTLEKRLREMLDTLDNYLEDTYGDMFSLNPNRLPRGEASSTLYDGLFSTSTKFTLGYGSESGRGYSVVIDISTLDKVDTKTKDTIEADAAGKLSELLHTYFPERDLQVVHDGNSYKIVGDLSLGIS